MSDVDFIDGLRYPLNEDEWPKTIGIGAVLEYLTFLIVPGFVLLGYYVTVMRQTLGGDPEPPEFEDWGRLVVDGIKACGILVVYLFVPIVAFLVLVIFTLLNGLSSGASLGTIFGNLLAGLVLSTVLFTVFMYVGAAGLARFAETDSIAAAFSPAIFSVLLSVEYLKAWVFVVAVSALSTVVLSVIALIPVVHFILLVLGPVQVKYVVTVYSRYWATGYASAMDIQTAAPTQSPSTV